MDTTIKDSMTGNSVDPFVSFTPIFFLDKFVYKNPKKLTIEGSTLHKQRGISAMQPIKLPASKLNTSSLPVNKKFLNDNSLSAIEKISEDEKFFYHFFRATGISVAKPSKGKKVEKKNDNDNEQNEHNEDQEFDKIVADKFGAMPDGSEDDEINQEDDNDIDSISDVDEIDLEDNQDNSLEDDDGLLEDESDLHRDIKNKRTTKGKSFEPIENMPLKKKKKEKLPMFASASDYLSD